MRALVIAAALLLPGARVAWGAEVSAHVSPRQVFAGVPFTLNVSISGYSAGFELPVLPEVGGLQLLSSEPNRQESTMTRIIGAQVTNIRSVELGYSFVAEREGTFTIPALTVVADGGKHATRPITFTVDRSETGDLLELELSSERTTCYVGEKIALSLLIRVKAFEDETWRVRFNERDMWSCVDRNRSSFGPFAGGQATVREERAGGAADEDAVFYVYELRGEWTPKEAGTLSFDDVRVLVDYPVQIAPARSIFDRGKVEVVSSRPVVARLQDSAVEVLLPPEEGRPAFYRGAVGRFEITASARPTEVAVGDPITLTMTVIDRTPGGAPLDTLPPPALEEVAPLTEGFRMPADPLAGVVEGRTKTFTQTIRARGDQVAEVPPIPYAYFDPRERRYAVAQSDPLEIRVHPASTLAIGDVIGAGPGAGRPTELTEVAGGILPNYAGAEVLAVQPPFRLTWAHGAATAAPPLAFGILALGRRRIRRLREDRGYARRRGAKRSALRRLSAARRSGPDARARETLTAVTNYVADRCDLPAGALTRAEVVERLRRAGVAEDLVRDVESLLGECEHLRYAGDGARGEDAITERAARCIERLGRRRLA